MSELRPDADQRDHTLHLHKPNLNDSHNRNIPQQPYAVTDINTSTGSNLKDNIEVRDIEQNTDHVHSAKQTLQQVGSDNNDGDNDSQYAEIQYIQETPYDPSGPGYNALLDALTSNPALLYGSYIDTCLETFVGSDT